MIDIAVRRMILHANRVADADHLLIKGFKRIKRGAIQRGCMLLYQDHGLFYS